MICPICNRPYDVTAIRANGSIVEVPMVAEIIFGIHGPIHICLSCMDAVIDLPESTRKLMGEEIDRFPPLINAVIRKHVRYCVLH